MSEKQAAKEEKKESKAEGKEALAKELEEKTQQLDELTETLQRLQAEFENFKKRNEKETQTFQEYANANIVLDFLPFLDSLESAVQAIEKTENVSKNEALEGMQKLLEQFQKLLEEKGLQEIKSLGERFDPEFHDCLMQENCAEKDDGVVLEELQKGYLFKGKVLRPAKVKINKIEKAEKKE